MRHLFWLLRVFDHSLGFTHGWEESLSLPAEVSANGENPKRVHRFTIRVDRSRHRMNYDD